MKEVSATQQSVELLTNEKNLSVKRISAKTLVNVVNHAPIMSQGPAYYMSDVLVHVEVALENPLLEGIWLWSFLLWLSRCLVGRLRHIRDGFGPIMLSSRGRAPWGGARARRKGERWSSTGDGTLSSSSELLGPIETLLVCSRKDIVRRGSWMLDVACL